MPRKADGLPREAPASISRPITWRIGILGIGAQVLGSRDNTVQLAPLAVR